MLDYLLKNETIQLSGELGNKIKIIAEEYKFFHWHLEFPEVFANGGFDCILGNPPWERIKLQEKEFFSSLAPEIANAPDASKRKKMITEIKSSNPELSKKYINALRGSECQSKFSKYSKTFSLTSCGDINFYALFAEQSNNLLNKSGRYGIVIPTGIATYYTYKDYFAKLINEKKLVSLIDFVNKEKIFPTVEANYRFSLLTFSNTENNKIIIGINLRNVQELNNKSMVYILNIDDIELINPNTKTLPMFNSRQDASIITQIYKRMPILINEQNNHNHWSIYYLRMFDMTNDSNLFITKEELENNGFKLNGNIFFKKNENYLPIYEAKLTANYNHRSSTFEGVKVEDRFKIHAGVNSSNIGELKNFAWISLPRYWVNRTKVEQAVNNRWAHRWFMGFRNAISAVADARSVSFCIIPKYGVGNSLPLILSEKEPKYLCALIANFNTFIIDYITRNKVSGGNLNFYIVKQLPIIPPDQYEENIIEYILPRVLELTYTSYDLKPFAEDCGYNGEPFEWDEVRRLELTTDLDALYGHLYKITKDKLEYILETFPIVKKRDIEKYGEYRTKRLILEKYDGLKDKFKNL